MLSPRNDQRTISDVRGPLPSPTPVWWLEEGERDVSGASEFSNPNDKRHRGP